MKNSIGSSIKGLAIVASILIGLGAIISGVSVIRFMTLTGLLIIGGGILLAVISYYVLTGFGQLVENSDIIAERYRGENESKQVEQLERQKKAAQKKLQDSSVPETEFIEFDCPFCGEEICFTKSEIKGGSVICPYCENNVDVKEALK